MNIECLVLSGGGHLGFIELGALYHLEKEHFWDRTKIKSIYGTSIGTIIAVLIAVNLDWDTINDYMIKRPWDKIFELKSNHILQLFEDKGIYDEVISLEALKSRVSACKHAIQIFTLSLEHSKMQGLTPKILKEITME